MTNKLSCALRLVIALVLCGTVSSVYAAVITNPALPITHVVNVQPIVASNDDGSETANFFGSIPQQQSIEGFIDEIWAQAGIDVNFLAPNFLDSTFVNNGDSGSGRRPTSDLGETIRIGNNAGVTAADPAINIFFVQHAAGFELLGANSAAGLARTPGNGISQYVGTNLLTFDRGRGVIASVVAHEIGHNLGLEHIVLAENLMQTSASPNQGERLNAAQIRTALNSEFTTGLTAVPVPAAAWLFGSALLGLAGLRRKRRA